MILLFSHTLSAEQIEDAKKWGIYSFLSLPNALQDTWSNISPDLEDVTLVLEEIKIYVEKNSKKGDFVLVQGDFGASYHMVNYVKTLGLIPVYATTKRVVEEYFEEDKSIKKSIFEHRRFRKYV